MESTLVWAGMWTSITISGLLLIPVILEFCKRNLPICFGLTVTLLTLYVLTPYSAGARAVWSPIEHLAETVSNSVHSLTGC